MKIEWKMAGFQGSRPFLDGNRGINRLSVLRHMFCITARVLFTGFVTAVFLALFPAGKVYAEPVKIVIDPGHGGDNLGAQHGGYTEKYMTMVVANAMAEELEKYEGIEVYLTRTDDVKLSLQQRADYAKEVDADFLFCLHFNMSENHTLYGTEVWVSAFGNCYAEGKSFGDLCLNELCTLDLYSRGVKTRLNKDGIDYYGIIQHCEEYGIPSAIIEHCHLDHREDAGRYETTEAMKKLGVLDATAVAKYYGLYSPTLGVDYRQYGKPKVEVPDSVMKPDTTEPVDVSITCLRIKEETGEVNILLTGKDEDSGLLYYDYSVNGGTSYSGLQKWEVSGNELECTIKVPVDQDIALKCRVYNGYDLYTESGVIEIPALQGNAEDAMENTSDDTFEETESLGQKTDENEEALEASGIVHQIDMSVYERQDAEKEKEKILMDSDDVSRFLWLMILGFLVSLLIFLMIVKAIWQKNQKKARRRGRRR
ncbi:MAG: N-acetylmuramoyl-L-alanine amidase [Lachnospiraceae bacterium]|nr:N-acetylmuramoyl-L-alanine amidase [Lachnospiraceae bacterium]